MIQVGKRHKIQELNNIEQHEAMQRCLPVKGTVQILCLKQRYIERWQCLMWGFKFSSREIRHVTIFESDSDTCTLWQAQAAEQGFIQMHCSAPIPALKLCEQWPATNSLLVSFFWPSGYYEAKTDSTWNLTVAWYCLNNILQPNHYQSC